MIITKKMWKDQRFIASLWFKPRSRVLEIYLVEMNLGTLNSLSDRERQMIQNKTKKQLIQEIFVKRAAVK